MKLQKYLKKSISLMLLAIMILSPSINIHAQRSASTLSRTDKLMGGQDAGTGYNTAGSQKTEFSDYKFIGNGFEVEFLVMNKWDGAFNANITIKNTGKDMIHNWSLLFQMDNTITNIWNASVERVEKGSYLIRNALWNQDINVGESVSFGFTATGNEIHYPDNYKMPGLNKETESIAYETNFIIYSDWGTGFSGAINIVNKSNTTIEDWVLEFDFDGDIFEIWNAVIQKNDGNHYIINNAVYNQNISPGESITVGFNGRRNDTASEPRNYKLKETTITDEDIEDEEIPEDALKLYVYTTYDSEKREIEIQWFTTQKNGQFEILESADNISYDIIDRVENQESYSYLVIQEFEKKYIKVRQTTVKGESVESFPFIVEKRGEEYIVEPIDSDGDGLSDIFESEIGTNRMLADTDDDGLTDYEEVMLTNTDPTVYSSVEENISDAQADSDQDGISNIEEIIFGTDPVLEDTDSDGLSDFEEIYIYNTDPLNADTDGDTVFDGYELILGLDPKNPETFGIPDAEYRSEQSISSDSGILTEINNEDSPYELSIDIVAGGYVEGDLKVRESSFSKIISNDAIVGIAPELSYVYSDTIDTVILKFEMKDNIKNITGNFPEEEELRGIKRYNIFKYFEDINMLLPIETQFDIEQGILFSEVDELGTYCVMDIEKWLDSLQPYAEEPQSFMSKDLFKEEILESQHKFMEEDTIINADTTARGISKDSDLDKSEMVHLMEEEINSTQSAGTNRQQTPVEVVFVIQSAGLWEEDFIQQKEMIESASRDLFRTYSDVSVCIIEYKIFSANIVGSFSHATWLPNATAVTTALSRITYEPTTAYCNRGAAFNIMLNLTFRENTAKFAFQIMNGLSSVGAGYFDQIYLCGQRSINYSEILSPGLVYASEEYARQVAEAIEETNGISLYMDDDTAAVVYQHILSHVAPPQIEFGAIVPTGWKKIILKGTLDSKNNINSDGDRYSDWEEVDTEKIQWDNSGQVILPTIQTCMKYVTKPYAEEGLSRFIKEFEAPGMPSSAFQQYLNRILNNTYILPIHSDPTLDDSDGDGYLDHEDPRPLKSDVRRVTIKNIYDFVPVEYDGKEEDYNKESLYYGGNQSWFYKKGEYDSNLEYYIEEGGCGPIAVTDMVMYVSFFSENPVKVVNFDTSNSNKFPIPYIDYSNYTKYVKHIVKDICQPIIWEAGWVTGTLGYLPFMVTQLIQGCFYENRMKPTIKSRKVKGSNKEKLLVDIEEQLKRDIPVQIMNGGNKVDMLQIDPYAGINGDVLGKQDFIYHWVNVLGVICDDIKGTKMLEVSSWGEKYIINYDEYHKAGGNLSSVILINNE